MLCQNWRFLNDADHTMVFLKAGSEERNTLGLKSGRITAVEYTKLVKKKQDFFFLGNGCSHNDFQSFKTTLSKG